MDPRYLGEDIDLDTLTDKQIPELKRCAALAKEEHERAMTDDRKARETRCPRAGYAREGDCSWGEARAAGCP